MTEFKRLMETYKRIFDREPESLTDISNGMLNLFNKTALNRWHLFTDCIPDKGQEISIWWDTGGSTDGVWGFFEDNDSEPLFWKPINKTI